MTFIYCFKSHLRKLGKLWAFPATAFSVICFACSLAHWMMAVLFWNSLMKWTIKRRLLDDASIIISFYSPCSLCVPMIFPLQFCLCSWHGWGNFVMQKRWKTRRKIIILLFSQENKAKKSWLEIKQQFVSFIVKWFNWWWSSSKF